MRVDSFGREMHCEDYGRRDKPCGWEAGARGEPRTPGADAAAADGSTSASTACLNHVRAEHWKTSDERGVCFSKYDS